MKTQTTAGTQEEVRAGGAPVTGKRAGRGTRRRTGRRARTGAAAPKRRQLTIHDLGWTEEDARAVRAQLASFAEDWDDRAMDAYDEP